MTVGRTTIRKALEAAGRQDADSVAKIVKALEKIGFDCDRDDARGGFSELRAWALIVPPLRLDTRQASIVQAAQRFAWSGERLPYTRPCSAVLAGYASPCTGKTGEGLLHVGSMHVLLAGQNMMFALGCEEHCTGRERHPHEG